MSVRVMAAAAAELPEISGVGPRLWVSCSFQDAVHDLCKSTPIIKCFAKCFRLLLVKVTLSSLKSPKELGISKSLRGRSLLMFLVCPITFLHQFLLLSKNTELFSLCQDSSVLPIPSLQLLPTRQATSFSTVPTEWTARRTSMQLEPFSSTAAPWTCTRLGSSTLSPKVPPTRLSTFWCASLLLTSNLCFFQSIHQSHQVPDRFNKETLHDLST